MSTKTITLAGSEIKAEFSGSNAWFRNDGADVIYAAAKPGITAGADGVVAIPAGQSAPVYGANGTVWLLGTGSVQLIGSDYSTNPFKTSAQSGGSGADEVARAAISEHSGNTDIHVTAAEKARYMQYCGLLTSGSLLDYVLTMTKSGFLYANANVTDTPDGAQHYFVEVRKMNDMFEVVATRINTNMVYVNHYNPTSAKWYGWKNTSDGGNAASVGAYTEAKLAALEARVAALEGN